MQTHPLEAYRDDLDALIGPIEELIAKIDALPGSVRRHAVACYTLGGLGQAKDTLEETVKEIDEFEPEADEEDLDAGDDGEEDEEAEETDDSDDDDL